MPRKPSPKKRQSILEAAAESFIEFGYDKASMDKIAELAAVSKRTVYNHFRTKELLFEAVIEDLIRQASKIKQLEWDPEISPLEQLLPLAKFKVVLASDPHWSGLLRVIFGMALRQPGFARVTAQQLEAGDQALAEWLRTATKSGTLSVPEPERSAKMFGHLAAGVLFWPALFGQGVPPEQVDEVARELVRMFLSEYAV